MAQHVGGVGLQRRPHPGADDHAAERQVAGGDRLGEGDEVGGDAVVAGGEPRAQAAKAGDDLVEDEQRPGVVAQLAQPAQVVGLGGVDAAGADDRLGDHRGDLVAPLGEQRPGGVEVVVGDGLDVVEQGTPAGLVERQALERRTAHVGAVVAERAGDDDLAAGLAGQRGGEAGQLEGRVDRLGARVGQEHPGLGHWRQAGDRLGQPVGGLVGEDVEGVVVLQRGHLGGHGVDDLPPAVAHVAVPEAGEAVDQPPPPVVDHDRALAPDDGDEAVGAGGGASEGVEQGRRGVGCVRGVRWVRHARPVCQSGRWVRSGISRAAT